MYLTCEVVIFYQGCNFPLWNSYGKYIIVLIISWVHQKLVGYMSGHMRLNYMQKKHILIWSKVIWTWPKRFYFHFFGFVIMDDFYRCQDAVLCVGLLYCSPDRFVCSHSFSCAVCSSYAHLTSSNTSLV